MPPRKQKPVPIPFRGYDPDDQIISLEKEYARKDSYIHRLPLDLLKEVSYYIFEPEERDRWEKSVHEEKLHRLRFTRDVLMIANRWDEVMAHYVYRYSFWCNYAQINIMIYPDGLIFINDSPQSPWKLTVKGHNTVKRLNDCIRNYFKNEFLNTFSDDLRLTFNYNLHD
jgi:hypothetical protein